MALLPILEFPDPRLRTKASPVKEINGKFVKLADDMLETMYAAPGVGLAANQVNTFKQVIVIDVSEKKDQSLILFNPEIITSEGEIKSDEGCLSVPGFWEPVTRFEHIVIKALNREGEEFTLEAHDFLSICIQHEMDHLEGKLFIDYISKTKRQLIRKKLLKLQKHQA